MFLNIGTFFSQLLSVLTENCKIIVSVNSNIYAIDRYRVGLSKYATELSSNKSCVFDFKLKLGIRRFS